MTRTAVAFCCQPASSSARLKNAIAVLLVAPVDLFAFGIRRLFVQWAQAPIDPPAKSDSEATESGNSRNDLFKSRVQMPG